MKIAFIFDVETTGLPRGRNTTYNDLQAYDAARIVSIAWRLVDVDGNEELKSRYYIVKPDGFEIPEDAVRIHGITTEQAMLEGVSMRDVIDDMTPDIEQCTELVAHNIRFDINVLRSELVRLKNTTLIDTTFTKTLFCTMLEARSRGVVQKFTKLTDLYTKLFPDEDACDNAHNAFFDVQYCYKIYTYLLSVPR